MSYCIREAASVRSALRLYNIKILALCGKQHTNIKEGTCKQKYWDDLGSLESKLQSGGMNPSSHTYWAHVSNHITLCLDRPVSVCYGNCGDVSIRMISSHLSVLLSVWFTAHSRRVKNTDWYCRTLCPLHNLFITLHVCDKRNI